ncbi:MAG: AEC family transporter [Lachnospiraceae bacterium]|nr:AEC family transporter [Lachnospiraceae bacterium]
MENLMIAVNAVVPFIVYLSFGYAARGLKLAEESFLNKLNTVAFKCFFPILMFNNFYTMDLKEGLDPGMIGFMLGFFFLTIVGLFLIVPRVSKENPRRGVIIQAIFRRNSLLFALPLAQSVFGLTGQTLASVAVAIMVPLYNVVAVIVLEYYRGGKVTAGDLIKRILTNPLIIGALIGLVFILLKIKLPACVEKPIAAFANMTSPLALFILGGTLHFSAIGKNAKAIIAGALFNLVILPALALLLSMPFSFSQAERFVIFVVFATPPAVSSFSMAATMGGDAELAGHLIVVETIASIVTIFLWILLLKSMAII